MFHTICFDLIHILPQIFPCLHPFLVHPTLDLCFRPFQSNLFSTTILGHRVFFRNIWSMDALPETILLAQTVSLPVANKCPLRAGASSDSDLHTFPCWCNCCELLCCVWKIVHLYNNFPLVFRFSVSLLQWFLNLGSEAWNLCTLES